MAIFTMRGYRFYYKILILCFKKNCPGFNQMYTLWINVKNEYKSTTRENIIKYLKKKKKLSRWPFNISWKLSIRFTRKLNWNVIRPTYLWFFPLYYNGADRMCWMKIWWWVPISEYVFTRFSNANDVFLMDWVNASDTTTSLVASTATTAIELAHLMDIHIYCAAWHACAMSSSICMSTVESVDWNRIL